MVYSELCAVIGNIYTVKSMGSKKILIFVSTVLAVIALVGYILNSKIDNDSKSFDVVKLATKTVDCKDNTDCMKEIFAKITKNSGIEVALNLLQIEINKHPSLGRYCHDIAHEVGDKGYIKDIEVEALLSKGNGICTGGFYHGVLNSWFSETGLSEEKLFKSVDLCQLLAATPGLVESCVHGALHTLYELKNEDYTESFLFCARIDERWQGSCAWAIGMEYQKRSEFKEAKTVEELFKQCDVFTKRAEWSLCASQLSRGFIKIFRSSEEGLLPTSDIWADFLRKCDNDGRCIAGAARELTTIYEYQPVVEVCVKNLEGVLLRECVFNSLWWSANLTRETNTWLERCNTFLATQLKDPELCKKALDYTVERRISIEGGEF